MNIAKAKKQVENALRAYLVKDEFGDYVLPLESQRPVFLMGPPGIGKTAIMAQIAHELRIGLVSYSMTHHTRQSALGLPFIEKESFAGQEYRTSHYTMSEIIATVHELIDATGLKEGILFLDEINCVSETLAPAMLQFLQFKTFGQHAVPHGWIIVTAGNPPEYNNSVREFDIVTWDRLKRIDIEPDYESWREYAINTGVHPAVLTYLELKKNNFYKVESTVDGRNFVTARGWVDLSRMIALYEHENLEVDVDLVGQYLQDADIAHDFANYYQLFNKYKADYQVTNILTGDVNDEIVNRAKKAPFDERLSLVSMVMDACLVQLNETVEVEDTVNRILSKIQDIKVAKDQTPVLDLVDEAIQGYRYDILQIQARGSGQRRGKRIDERAIAFMNAARDEIESTDKDGYEILKTRFNAFLDGFKQRVEETKSYLNNSFDFMDVAFTGGQENLIFVTELTANETAAGFITRYGCDKYFQHNKDLLFYERQKSIIENLAHFEL